MVSPRQKVSLCFYTNYWIFRLVFYTASPWPCKRHWRTSAESRGSVHGQVRGSQNIRCRTVQNEGIFFFAPAVFSIGVSQSVSHAHNSLVRSSSPVLLLGGRFAFLSHNLFPAVCSNPRPCNRNSAITVCPVLFACPVLCCRCRAAPRQVTFRPLVHEDANHIGILPCLAC